MGEHDSFGHAGGAAGVDEGAAVSGFYFFDACLD